MNKQHVTIILAVIGLIGAAAGGSYALDFSSTTTGNTSTDNSVTSGDVINNYITETIQQNEEELWDIGRSVALDVLCDAEPLPEEYIEQCVEYWCSGEDDYYWCIEREYDYYFGEE